MTRASKSDKPSVFDEPHMHGGPMKADPSEAKAAAGLRREAPAEASEDARVDRTVWDEPGLSRELAGGPPAGELTYRDWLVRRRDGVSAARTWAVTLGLAVAAGPWAVLGAFFGSRQGHFTVLVVVVFGPVAEEVMKVAAPFYVVERRPFLFRSPAQIVLCALAAGLAFAAIENVIYLGLYIPRASQAMVAWRWTVCVAVHMGCSLVAGMGVIRVWRDCWERMDRPRLWMAFPYQVVAIAIHAVYNAAAVAFSVGHGAF
ncbi:MAG: PrsW family intramembrane metalloprotease [Candidatus Brocadiaceae bacterium]|nr:PrsW family intramembrane metalloprotease [Candidatus Brocadiaceae bacterium]